jgi:hypothetical protein
VQHPPQRRPRRHIFMPTQIKQDVIDMHIAQAGSSSPPQTFAPLNQWRPTLAVLLVLHEHRMRVRGAAGGIRLPLEAGALGRRNEGEEASTYAELSDTSPNQSARASTIHTTAMTSTRRCTGIQANTRTCTTRCTGIRNRGAAGSCRKRRARLTTHRRRSAAIHCRMETDQRRREPRWDSVQ